MEPLINSLATWGIGGILMAIVVYFYWSQTQKLYAMMESDRQDRREEKSAGREMLERITHEFTLSLKEVEADFRRAVDSICEKLEELTDRVDRWEIKR